MICGVGFCTLKQISSSTALVYRPRISPSPELSMKLTSGTVLNLGNIRGADGISIAKSEINEDGELVIIHDATVDRTTDGTGKVNEKTLAEIKALDAGIKKGEEFKGCRIPTLIEFMEFVKDLPDMTVDFELKEYPVDGNEEVAYSVCDRVMKIIDEYGYTDRCVVNTFNARLHEYIHVKNGKK